LFLSLLVDMLLFFVFGEISIFLKWYVTVITALAVLELLNWDEKHSFFYSTLIIIVLSLRGKEVLFLLPSFYRKEDYVRVIRARKE